MTVLPFNFLQKSIACCARGQLSFAILIHAIAATVNNCM